LGEENLTRPLEDTLRECCRILRPAKDRAEQRRFEDEFVELGIWPGSREQVAA
jgi:putative hemolysin